MSTKDNINSDPCYSANQAGLKYIDDFDCGIYRKRAGKGFAYFDRADNKITDPQMLHRIKSLVIPPAWENVWVCEDKSGHLQATGIDAKGRKQYLYHPEWSKIRNETKFHRMLHFGEALPLIRERLNKDLRLRKLSRKKVLAVVLQLLKMTLIRVGNKEYAQKNQSYGLTTLRHKHIDLAGNEIEIHFKGKRGKKFDISIKDKKIINVLKRCMEIPGYELFQYYDQEGNRHVVDSGDVNEYIQEITGEDFTAKDFRTWGGTVKATYSFEEAGPPDTQTSAKKIIVQTVKNVAEHLNNTPSICRKYYIHPVIIESFEDRTLFDFIQQAHHNYSSGKELSFHEHVVMNVLKNKG